MKKFITFIILFAGIYISKAQDLNAYRYVIVPEKFEFLKEADQYQLNSLAKFLFEKHGFEAFIEGEEMPLEFVQNRCEGLLANVANESGLFRTRLILTLKDCNNRVVYTSPEGTSAEKDFQTAYHEALRNAFSPLGNLNYNYRETIVSGRPEINRIPETETPKKEVSEKVDISPHAEVRVNPKPVVKPTVDNAQAGNFNFTKGDNLFFLEKTSNGYSFFQKGMAEPFAALIQTSTGNNFIYSSITSKGMAYFDENGNLVVEVLNPQSNTLETVLYKAQP
ncbi:hypothetical protein FK178_14490 [Antarcticibacterium arcticum]|uniref:Uncharacterized protein n=1 Tax=Antarcticibacterium arcticum TaxID=2585771 RepID=A0A5B8YRQ8_9FLAO|nr:hypothetical protein [Antarcticibacterium arcticum]QED38849.1 hypothetical protein FK178_14490 [Antarcticibacterium arcticum]